MATRATAFRDHFNDVVEAVHRYAVFVRDIGLQEQSVNTLDDLIAECVAHKKEAIAEKVEFDANGFLCFQLMANALREEFLFYLALKNDDSDKAWDHLINAQQNASSAVKAHDFGSHLEHYIHRLLLVEKAFFPTPVFMSSGFVVKKSECSICGSEYGVCDHIKGTVYMGQMCARVVTEAELREVSVVSDPADKHCRAITFTEGDVTKNVFTHRIIDTGKTTSANTPNNDAPVVDKK